MIRIERKFSPNYRKSSWILYFVFFGIMIGFGLLSSLIPYDLLGRPILNGILRVYHLLPIGIFAFIITLSLTLNRRGRFAFPTSFLTKEEQREFQERYNQDRQLQVPSTKKIGLIILGFILLLYLILPLPTYLGWDVSERAGQIWFYGVTGLFIIVYAWYLGRYFKRNRDAMPSFFQLMNQKLSDTNIVMLTEASNGPTSALSSTITGRFKGHEFKLSFFRFNPALIKSYARSRMAGGGGNLPQETLNYKNTFQLNASTKQNFTLEENDREWRVIEGNNLNEAFLNRFRLTGIQASELTDVFKQRLLDYQRVFRLELKGEMLTYSSASAEILPYYGVEGIILFLDFMNDLAKELEKEAF